MIKHCACLLAALALSTAPLAAHDMWIEPAAFFPDAGKIIGLRLRVGENLQGSAIPYISPLIDQFVSVDSTGRKPVVGREGAEPAGLVRVAAPGMLVIGYQSKASQVELAADKFNQYLKEEGLEAIAEVRARRNQSGTGAREIFTRCAKSLIVSGKPATEADRALGFTLELVTLKNPYTLQPGEDLPVVLTYEGRPVQGVLVVAMNRVNPSARLTARTDKHGRVSFRLLDPGMWMIKAVHMVPAPADANADWASYWASTTFELKN